MKVAMKGATVALVFVLSVFAMGTLATSAFAQVPARGTTTELKVLKLRYLPGNGFYSLVRAANTTMVACAGRDLVVQGTPEAIAKLEDIVNQIDTPDQAAGYAGRNSVPAVTSSRAVRIIVTAKVTQHRDGKTVQVLRGFTDGIGMEGSVVTIELSTSENRAPKGHAAVFAQPFSLSVRLTPTLAAGDTKAAHRQASLAGDGNFTCYLGKTLDDTTQISKSLQVATPIDLKGHPVTIASGTVPTRDGSADFVVRAKMFEMSGRLLPHAGVPQGNSYGYGGAYGGYGGYGGFRGAQTSPPRGPAGIAAPASAPPAQTPGQK